MEKTEKIMKSLRLQIAKIITLLVAIALALAVFTNIILQNTITSDLLVNWFLGFIASTFVYLIWVYEGKKAGYILERYINAKSLYTESVVAILKNKLVNDLPDFCKRKTEENIENVRMIKLRERGYFPKLGIKFEDIDICTLNKSQLKQYNKLKEKTKAITILPNQLYCNSNVSSLYNAEDYSKTSISIKLIIRVITSILITLVMAMMLFMPGAFSFAKVVQMVMYICLLVSCVYMGKQTGYNSVTQQEVDTYIRRTRLNQSFLIEKGFDVIFLGGEVE